MKRKEGEEKEKWSVCIGLSGKRNPTSVTTPGCFFPNTFGSPYAQKKDDWGHIWTVYLPNWKIKGFYNQVCQNPCFREKLNHKQIG